MRDAEAGDAVARVRRETQQRQRVLDVRRVEKLQAAELDERNVAPRQLQLQRRRVVRGAEQHRLRFQAVAGFAVFQHAQRDEARLVAFLADRDQFRRSAAGALAPQVLGEALGRQRDHSVGRGEDRLGRAIVALERDDARRRREALRKLEDVAHRRGAKGIDRLRVVADHGQAAPFGPQLQHDLGLQAVGVLVFVDQQMVEARRDLRGDRRLAEHLGEIEQQVVVIEHALALLGLDIGRE